MNPFGNTVVTSSGRFISDLCPCLLIAEALRNKQYTIINFSQYVACPCYLPSDLSLPLLFPPFVTFVVNSFILHNFDFILFLLPPFSDSSLKTSGFIPCPRAPETQPMLCHSRP